MWWVDYSHYMYEQKIIERRRQVELSQGFGIKAIREHSRAYKQKGGLAVFSILVHMVPNFPGPYKHVVSV